MNVITNPCLGLSRSMLINFLWSVLIGRAWQNISLYDTMLNVGRCVMNWSFLCHNSHWWKAHSVVSWWRHPMETFFTLLALCAGNSPATGEFPHKDQWRGALMCSLICAWINGCVNNHEAGDLRRHRTHYDVTVMFINWHKGFESTSRLRVLLCIFDK